MAAAVSTATQDIAVAGFASYTDNVLLTSTPYGFLAFTPKSTCGYQWSINFKELSTINNVAFSSDGNTIVASGYHSPPTGFEVLITVSNPSWYNSTNVTTAIKYF